MISVVVHLHNRCRSIHCWHGRADVSMTNILSLERERELQNDTVDDAIDAARCESCLSPVDAVYLKRCGLSRCTGTTS